MTTLILILLCPWLGCLISRNVLLAYAGLSIILVTYNQKNLGQYVFFKEKADFKQMEMGGEGILGREGVEPKFGGQNAVLCSDSLIELTPQQVKDDDREWRVRREHRSGSLGWEHLGILPGGALTGMVIERCYPNRVTSQFAQEYFLTYTHSLQ